MSARASRDVEAILQPVVRNLCARLAAGDVSRLRGLTFEVTRQVASLTVVRVEFEAFVEGADFVLAAVVTPPPVPAVTGATTPDPRPARDLSGIHEE